MHGVIIFLIVILFIYLIISYFLFRIVSRVDEDKVLKVITDNVDKTIKPYKYIWQKGADWVKSQPGKDVYIKSFDNLKLHGLFVGNQNCKGTMILAHGYRSTKERDLYASSFEYFNMGYNLLYIDMRGCGESEGSYITFGYKESKDIKCWVDYIRQNYKGDIILAGISMGATSVLLADKTHVKAVLCDSAFVNAWDEVKYCISHYFHVPGWIFVPGINIFTILIAGFNLKKINTINALKDTDIPILFVHGADDDFVPCQSSFANYENYKGKKELLIVEKANHGMGYLLEKENYIEKVKNILNV